MDATACVTWIRRGTAKEKPDVLKLDDEQLSRLVEHSKADGSSNDLLFDSDIDDDDDVATAAKTEESSAAGSAQKRKRKATDNDDDRELTDGDKSRDHVIDTYNLDAYDEEEDDMAARVVSMAGLSYYGKNADDPYLKDEVSVSDSDDELTIQPDDNLIVVGKANRDQFNLEVWVYNEAASNLYCHHDYLLSEFPLAVEFIGVDPGDKSEGNMVAVGNTSPVIELWDIDVVNTLEPAFQLGSKKAKKKKKKNTGAATEKLDSGKKGHSDAVLALSWNRLNQSCLASASADHRTGIWDIMEGSVVAMLRLHTDKVQCLQWHPVEQRILLTGSFDHTVRLSDIGAGGESNSRTWRFAGEVEKVAWNIHNPNQFLASTDSGRVYCMDVRAGVGEPLYSLDAHVGAVTGLEFSYFIPGCLVTTSEDQTVRIWDLRGSEQRMVSEKKLKIGPLFCGGASPDSALLFAIGGEREMKVINLKNDAAVSACFLEQKQSATETVLNHSRPTISSVGTSSSTKKSVSMLNEVAKQQSDSDSADDSDPGDRFNMQKAAAPKLKKKSLTFQGKQKKIVNKHLKKNQK